MPSVTDQGIVGYMCNNGNSYPYKMGDMRMIIGSCTNMDEFLNGGNECDDAWLILPGYKVVLYRYTGYSGTYPSTLDNTAGQYPKMFKLNDHVNKTKSFKSYYKGGNELPDISSDDMYNNKLPGPSK